MLLHAGVSSVVLAMAMAVARSVVLDRGLSKAESKNTPSFSMRFRAEHDPPRKKDMNPDKLNRLIGSDFNEMWMSKTPIIAAASRNATDAFGGMLQNTGPDNLQFPERLPAQYQEMMRTWLVRRSSCPVEFVWTDLGKQFWPRWIKIGRCGRSETMSCSWPPGMLCMPSSTRVLNLLRWHCWLKKQKKQKQKQK